MNKKLVILAVSALLAMVVGTSSAQSNTATATAEATARVIKPIRLTWNQPLSFGQFTVGSGGGTATIAVAGVSVPNQNYIFQSPTTTGDVTALSTSQATAYTGNKNPGPAVFSVTGEHNFTFGIELPPVTQAIPVHLLNQDPGPTSNELTVDGFASVVGAGAVVGSTGTLSVGAGTQFFAVGGVLHVPGSAVPGAYTGSFLVNVFYN